MVQKHLSVIYSHMVSQSLIWAALPEDWDLLFIMYICSVCMCVYAVFGGQRFTLGAFLYHVLVLRHGFPLNLSLKLTNVLGWLTNELLGPICLCPPIPVFLYSATIPESWHLYVGSGGKFRSLWLWQQALDKLDCLPNLVLLFSSRQQIRIQRPFW